MRKAHIFKCLLAIVAYAVLSGGLFAHEPNCDQIAFTAIMARSASSVALAVEKQRAGDSYRAQVVFATRLFELHPTDKSAAIQLLNLIPKDDTEQNIWMTFGDSLCDAETVADMKSLGRIGERLPRTLAKAVLLIPDKLPAYVSYALTSVQDSHSDYAVQMQNVCRTKHAEFLKAVGNLPIDKRDWFVKHILKPDDCHALALPEAD
jgi:hypothetical protein